MINITDERARRLWQREMDRQMEFLQSPYARSLTALLKRQFGAAADFVRQGMLDAIGIAVDRTAKDQSELLMAHYRKVATVFGKKAFGIMDGMKLVSIPEMKSPMDEFWTSVNLWTSTQAAIKIRNIQATTKDSIAAIVQSGMREQLSHRDIAKKIEKTSNQINPYRARTIALTETHTAAVKSVDAAVKSTRIEMEKEWVSSKDARTRTRDQGSPFEHFATFPAGADEERVPQDDKFIGTGEPMDLPGDPKGSAGNVVRCLTSYGTPIFTSEGWKQVRHVKVDDLVLTHRNRFRKVLRLNENYYDGDVIKICLGGRGKFIVVTPEHPFLVRRLRNGRITEWKNAEDIVKDDIINFMGSYCQYCEKSIPYYNSFCNISCSSKKHGEGRKNNPAFSEERRQSALKQWKNPEHRENISQKASVQMKREFKNGTRNRFEITKKAREAHFEKWGEGGSFKILGKTKEFRDARRKSVEKKYGSVLDMLKKTAFPALGKLNHGGSELEQAMSSFLLKKGKEFTSQFLVGGRRVDFYIENEKLFIEVDGFPWHEDKERDRKRDLEILTQYPDHKIVHVSYKENPPKWEFFDLVSLNHSGTFSQIGVPVRSVARRKLKRKINTYNFAVEEDESYIANGFVTHNCRCVVLYHPVNRIVQEELKPYEPEEILGDLDIGSAVDSPDDVLRHYSESEKATYTEGLDASQMKAAIADRLGGRAYSVRTKEMDEFINFYLDPNERVILGQVMEMKHYVKGTRNIISQWAMTSGDENSSSIMLQLAAKEEFKLKGASTWWRKAELNQAKDLLKTHRKPARQFLRLMYEDTQAHLRKQGLKSVRLVRGFKNKKLLAEGLSSVKKPLSKATIKLQPMSSFSTNSMVSEGFAGGFGEGKYQYLIFTETSIERVLSTPVTGFGCKREFEYVILGSQKKIGERALMAVVDRDGAISFRHLFGEMWIEEDKVAKAIWKETKEDVTKKPMTVIGNLSKCIIGQKDFVNYDVKERPLGCDDYVREGKKWLHRGKEIDDEIILQRLNKMKLPPSWVNVTASRDFSSKIQAIGQDKAGRWQYRYLAEHVGQASVNKFNRVKSFSQDIAGIRRGIEKGMGDGDSRAFLLEIENRTAMRIGTDRDFLAKQKAYGLTTLQNEHVQITGNRIVFNFIAKEGILARYELEDKVLADWIRIRKARMIAGEKLFPDVSGKKLNEYLKELSGKDYTVKDFRTYHATRIAHDELRSYAGKELTGKEKSRVVKMVSEKVGRFLHNTPTTAKNSYINPLVWDFIGGL